MFIRNLQFKILILVGSMLGALALYFFMSSSTSSSNLAILTATTDQVYPVLQASDSNLFYIERLSSSLNTAAATKELEELKVADDIFQKMDRTFSDIMTANNTLTPEVELLRTSLKDYYLPARELSQSMASGKSQEWNSELIDKAQKTQLRSAAFTTELKAFHARRLSDFTATIAAVASGTRHLRLIGYLLIIGAIILTIVIVLAANRGIVRPIITLSNASQQVSKGSFPVLGSSSSKDEIGVLWANFSNMIRDIEEHQTQLAKLATLGRNLSSQTTMTGILEVIHASLPETVGFPTECRLYFAASCFLEQHLEVGFYDVEQSTINPTLMHANFFADKTERTIWVEDSRSKECLAAICIAPMDPNLISKVRSVLHSLSINIANALSSIRLEDAMRIIVQKSLELRTIFGSISQGICTIGGDGSIKGEYSTYLEKIVGERGLNGKLLGDLLFTKANISADMLAQAQTALDCIVGEDILNYDFNKDSLPRELSITDAVRGKHLHLEIDWIPLANEEELVSSIMVTIRDITEIVSLRQNAKNQAEDTQMIEELLGTSAERFLWFKESTATALEDCRATLAVDASLSPMDLARIARHLHTVKGNSRALGLKRLSNSMHDLETTFFTAFPRDGAAASSKSAFHQSLTAVSRLFGIYTTFNDDKLGRANNTVATEYLGRLKGLISRLYEEKLAPSTADMEMLDAYSSPHGPLVLSEAIQEIFEGIHEICGSMNLRLPQLILAGDKSVGLGSHMASNLRSILIHLLRNSVDHGLRHELEPKIMIDWAIGEQGHLALEYADSGRGLHLARLAEVGTRLGITGPSSTEEDLAALIFRSGLSTKSSVTELSGRGIGMDAVRAMCRELGGDILLHFTGPSDPDGYRRFAFTLQMGPANIELEHKTMTTAEIGLRLTG